MASTWIEKEYLRSAVRPAQLGAEVVDECADVEPGEILLPVQGPIDKPDRLEPVAVLEELLPGYTIRRFAHLQPGQADRHLNAVADPMVQFLDQDLPAFQQLLQPLLGTHADGDLARQLGDLLIQYRERLVRRCPWAGSADIPGRRRSGDRHSGSQGCRLACGSSRRRARLPWSRNTDGQTP